MKQKHECELLTAFMQEKHLSNYKLAQMMGVYGSAVKYWQKLEHIPDDLTDVLEVWYFVQKHDRNRDYSRYLVR